MSSPTSGLYFFFSGKCTVSSFKDFLSCRPTEMPEENVLLCESRYIESEKQMKKFKGLKRFSLSAKVVEDEIYYFRSVASFLLTTEVIQIFEKHYVHKKQTLEYSDESS